MMSFILFIVLAKLRLGDWIFYYCYYIIAWASSKVSIKWDYSWHVLNYKEALYLRWLSGKCLESTIKEKKSSNNLAHEIYYLKRSLWCLHNRHNANRNFISICETYTDMLDLYFECYIIFLNSNFNC